MPSNAGRTIYRRLFDFQRAKLELPIIPAAETVNGLWQEHMKTKSVKLLVFMCLVGFTYMRYKNRLPPPVTFPEPPPVKTHPKKLPPPP